VPELAARMADIWAKSERSGGGGGVSLLQHSLDVCGQMWAYFDTYRPEWPLGDDVCVGRILAYAALLHDFGKVHGDFQKMLRPGGARFDNRHEILSLAFCSWLDVPEVERPWLEAAIAFHHKGYQELLGAGRRFYLGERFEAPGSPASELARGVGGEQAELLAEVLQYSPFLLERCGWYGLAPYSLRTELCFDFLGAMRGSLERVRRLSGRFQLSALEPGPRRKQSWAGVLAAIHTRGWMLNADHVASFGPQALKRGLATKAEVDRALVSRIRSFNSHQRNAAVCEGSAILVAPTGSGKTESALRWAANQSEAGGLAGRTYFLLPYQTSMNAMQRRLVTLFAPEVAEEPGRWNSEVALVHGRSLRAIYERLLDRSYAPEEAARMASLQADVARLNVAPICVCSPFQVIRLLFADKGVEGLLATFSEARFVLDEIHAYDMGTTSMALTALQVLLEYLGCRALFMTATLPWHLRKVLGELFGQLPVIPVEEDVVGRPPRHKLRLLDCGSQSEEAAGLIAERARDGSVLVVLNQVDRARNLFERFSRRGCDARLLHSRFTYLDRARKEQDLDPVMGRILIATQAVEVSLDLDYSYCFSELAPVESLLQRFGRCNRRGRQPEPAEIGVFCRFAADERRPHLPYEEGHLGAVLSTLQAFLDGRPERELAESEIQSLIDSSYPASMRDGLFRTISEKSSELRSCFIDTFLPFGMADGEVLRNLEEKWEELFDGEEVLPAGLVEVARSESSWVGRARYLVPISRRRFVQYRTAGRIWWDKDLLCGVIDAPYSSRVGLDFGHSHG